MPARHLTEFTYTIYTTPLNALHLLVSPPDAHIDWGQRSTKLCAGRAQSHCPFAINRSIARTPFYWFMIWQCFAVCQKLCKSFYLSSILCCANECFMDVNASCTRHRAESPQRMMVFKEMFLDSRWKMFVERLRGGCTKFTYCRM